MSYHHLTLEEREKLSLLLKNCYGIRTIARELGRNPSTICRELKRNASAQKGEERTYRFLPADELYRARIHRKRFGKYGNVVLTDYVRRRQRIGDWELDTIVSANDSNSGLLSMCDRKSRYCMLFLLRNSKSNYAVYKILAAVSDTMPCLTFTADQGVEFHCYKEVEAELNIPFYSCSPHSPWQKGSVENLNGLVREFFPRGTDFSDVSQEEVANAMSILNNRPKKYLGWATPAEVLASSAF